MSIAIVKGTDSVIALIGSIGVKQADYRNNVSSAVLSAVAHSVEHNETSLVTKLLNEVFSVAYRDLPVIKKFIESVTPIVLIESVEGRRKRLNVADCQFMKNNIDRNGKKQSEIVEASKKALSANLGREKLLADFINNEPVKVRNLEWKEGDSADTKTVGVQFGCDIFAWFEEIEYIRKAVQKAKDEEEETPTIDASLSPKIATLLTAFEKVPVENRSAEFTADLTALQDIATRFANRLKAEQAAKEEAKRQAANEKARDAIFSGKSVNLTEDQQNAACEFLRSKGVTPKSGELFVESEMLAGYKEMIGAVSKEETPVKNKNKKAA